MINTLKHKGNLESEYNILKQLDSPYLIKLFGEDFYAFNKYYCFSTEFCEVMNQTNVI